MTHHKLANEKELREAIIRTSSVIIGENSLGYIYEELPDTQIDALIHLLHQYGNTREQEGSDLKYILEKLPKRREGRELTLNYDRDDNHWYVGYPNEAWDFSVDLHANDKDPEGACLNLLSQLDELTKTKEEE